MEEFFKQKLRAEDIFLSATSIGLLVLNISFLYYEYEQVDLLGWMLMGNGLFWSAAFLICKKLLSSDMKRVFLLVSASLIGIAIPLLIDERLIGLSWAVEGFILLGCGFIFGLPAVRREAYLLLIIACSKSFLSFDSIYTYWGSSLFTTGFFHLLMIGIILAGVLVIWKWNKSLLSDNEKLLAGVLEEIFVIWSSISLLIISFYYLNVWTFNLAIVLVYAYLFTGNRFNLRLTELLGFAALLLVGSGYLVSMQQTGSFRFHEQTFAGKIAAIEVFLSLFVFQSIYEKWWKENEWLAFTRQLRKLFFLLLPIIWLPSAHRHFPDWFSVFVWVSVGICWVLSVWRKYPEQFIQLKIMIPLASLALVYPLNWAGLAASMMVMWLAFWLLKANERSIFRKSPYKGIFSFTWLHTAWLILLAMILLWETDGVMPGLALSGLFLTLVYHERTNLPSVRKIGNMIAGIQRIQFALLVLVIFGLGVSGVGFVEEVSGFTSEIIAHIALLATFVFYGRELYKRLALFPTYMRGRKYMVEWIFFHMCLLATYWGMAGEFLGLPLGIVVSILTLVHGVILLFHELNPALRSLAKISWWLFGIAFVKLIFFDFQHFELWSKIVVSMVFGLVMLGGSRLFLKKLSVHHP